MTSSSGTELRSRTPRTYEEIHDAYGTIEAPRSPGSIGVAWLAEGRLAIGRDSEEQHLILLVGTGFEATRETVRDAMAFREWRSEDQGSIAGHRLLLPSGDHFRSAMSTVAAELLRGGIDERPVATVFHEVEPLIELVIRRLILPKPVLLGLLGELIVLRWLLRSASETEDARAEIVRSWKGHQRSARDFVIGTTALEVKTTTRDVAQHTIDNIDQTGPRDTDEKLFLVSLGLRATETGQTMSVAGLTEECMVLLAPGWSPGMEFLPSQRSLLTMIRQYGPDDSLGYDHTQMRSLGPYVAGYTFSYPPRLYDIGDPNISIIRRSSIDGTAVLPQGLTYRVLLPEKVRDSIENPRLDVQDALEGVVRAASSSRTARGDGLTD